MALGINEARQIIGAEGARLSDQEVAELLELLNGLAADLFELQERDEL